MGNEYKVGALVSELIEKFGLLDEAVQKLVSAFDRLERRVDELSRATDNLDDLLANDQTNLY